MTEMVLAQALLRRKELQQKVDQLRRIKEGNFFQMRIRRVSVNESTDNITAQVPVLAASQVTREYDHAARQLRLIDQEIQRANWNTSIEVDPLVLQDYVEQNLPTPERRDQEAMTHEI